MCRGYEQGASDKKEEEEEKKPKQSAAGKALAERLAKQRAEEERIKKQEVRFIHVPFCLVAALGFLH